MRSRESESAALSHSDYYDLGSYSRPVTAQNSSAQIWFDRGLVWSYAFNHEEAAECFSRAISEDASCAMAYWGLAYSLGPNYNKPWEFFGEQELKTTVHRTHAAVVRARELAPLMSPVEHALIDALRYRYRQETAPEDIAIWNTDYAAAMRTVYESFPNDLDVATLFADSLMNLTPWRLWDISTGEPAAGAHTLEAKCVLDLAMAQRGGSWHPGLLHLYIHLMEMSNTPEAALRAADQLRILVPDAGHLNHMPTHIDVLCGDYRRAIVSNSDAIRADQKLLARNGPLNFYTLYRSHNYHFRIYAAMFAGQSKIALDTSAQLAESIPKDLLLVKSPPMADWLESFVSIRMHVLVRFGCWEEILKVQPPRDSELYCTTIAMMHYARGIALAITKRTTEAAIELDLLKKAIERVPPSRTLFNNKCVDILAIAVAMLTGEIQYRQGKFAIAFDHLRDAISLEDSLPYDEPWGWMQPTRHAYGALLLEQGLVEDAAEMYCADLGFDATLPRAQQHPNNVWALHGYHECLERLGRFHEAHIIRPQLNIAQAITDVPVRSSCCCRLIHDYNIT